MPRKTKSTSPTTRIVEPETEHVHAPITRMDGSPAFGSSKSSPPPADPEPPEEDGEESKLADKPTTSKKSG